MNALNKLHINVCGNGVKTKTFVFVIDIFILNIICVLSNFCVLSNKNIYTKNIEKLSSPQGFVSVKYQTIKF